VKFGIDKRDSMLTRENFKDTWARTKPEEKKKGVGKTDGDEMRVDMPPMNGSLKQNEDRHDTGMGGVDETTTAVEKTAEEGRNGKSKLETRMKMPIFAFQRRGIGAVKSNVPRQKPKLKNKQDSLPPLE
jgi:hypothetical protein